MTDEEKKDNGSEPALKGGDASPPGPESVTLPAVEVEKLRAAAAEQLDRAKRTQAEFVNYQARMRREREEFSRYACEGFLRELLPFVDDVQRLTAAAQGVPALLEAVQITERELLRVLSKAGVKPVETEGRKFDPTFHEAAEMVDAPAGKAAGDVIGEVRKGYLLHDRVLRPASVRVAKAPQA